MNCLDSKRNIKKFNLLVGEVTEFNLTEDRVYCALDRPRGDLVTVVNDKGIKENYSIEYFRFYNGESIVE